MKNFFVFDNLRKAKNQLNLLKIIRKIKNPIIKLIKKETTSNKRYLEMSEEQKVIESLYRKLKSFDTICFDKCIKEP